MDRIIEKGHNMLTFIEMMLRKDILHKNRIIGVKVLEVDIEVTIKVTILEIFRHIYKKVELGGVINVDAVKQEIEDKLGKDNIDDDKVNPHHNIIINNIDKENLITKQMEQWSILSNVVNYVQYDRNPGNFYDLDIKTIDQKSHRKIYDRLKY